MTLFSKKINNYIIFYIPIIVFIFIISKLILNAFNLDFLNWIYKLFYYVILIIILVGLIQIIILKKITVFNKILNLFLLITVYIGISFIISYFLYKIDYLPRDKIEIINEKKYVVIDKNSLLHGEIRKYRYINKIVREKKELIRITY